MSGQFDQSWTPTDEEDLAWIEWVETFGPPPVDEEEPGDVEAFVAGLPGVGK